MIITLKGAKFTTNIGTLDTWRISADIDPLGAVYDGPTSVDRDPVSPLNATVTITEGYELNGSVVVTMGGVTLTEGITVDGNTITINIAAVTGNVVIKVPTKNTNTGEEDNGNEEVPEGAVLITSGSLAGAYYYENGHFNSNEDGGVYVTEGETTNYFFIEYIPVQPNTQYRLAKARDTIFVDSNKNKVDRFNINSLDTNWVFTTPANCAYMSTCVNKNDVTDYTTMELEIYSWVEKSTTLLSEIDGVTYREGGISGDSYTDTTTAGYFSYKDIPITAGVRYSIPYARNSWYLDSSKNAVSLVNPNSLNNNWTITVPDGVAYISCVFKTADIDYTTCSITEYELSS